MKRFITILFSLFSVVGYSQIDLNKQSDVHKFLETKYSISTLSDTSTINNLYDGLLVVVQDTDQLWQYDGSSWNMAAPPQTLQSVTENGNTTNQFLALQYNDTLIFDTNGIYMLEDTFASKGIGFQLGQNNTGVEFTGGSGHALGRRNTGNYFSGGAGPYLGQDNSGDDFSGGAGWALGRGNIGDKFSGGAGVGLGQDNSGVNFSGGAGYVLGRRNTGDNFSGGAGFALGENNSGVNFSGGAGWALGSGNTGDDFSGGAGFQLGQNNKGNNFSGGAGFSLGRDNIGDDFSGGAGYGLGQCNTGNFFSGGAGYYLGRDNSGDNFSGAAGWSLGFLNTGVNFSGLGFNSGLNNNADNAQLLGANITTNAIRDTIFPTSYDYINNAVTGDFSAFPIGRVINFMENNAGEWRLFTVVTSDSATLNYDIVSPNTFDIIYPKILTDITGIGEGVDLVQSNTIILGEGEDVGINTNTPDYKLDVEGDVNVNELILTPTGTANQPVSETGSIYFNGDDNEVKISKDGLTWEPLVPIDTDTIIRQYPIIPFTGNAADTIASNQTYYFTMVDEALANRKIVKLEISTYKNVNQDLGFWLYSLDDRPISGLLLPTTGFYNLPAGTKHASWDVTSPTIPEEGKPLTLNDLLYLETLLGSDDGVGGLEDYVADEGANGLYLTLYFVE